MLRTVKCNTFFCSKRDRHICCQLSRVDIFYLMDKMKTIPPQQCTMFFVAARFKLNILIINPIKRNDTKIRVMPFGYTFMRSRLGIPGTRALLLRLAAHSFVKKKTYTYFYVCSYFFRSALARFIIRRARVQCHKSFRVNRFATIVFSRKIKQFVTTRAFVSSRPNIKFSWPIQLQFLFSFRITWFKPSWVRLGPK